MRKLTKAVSGLELTPALGSNPRLSDFSASIRSVVEIDCEAIPPVQDPVVVAKELRKVFKGHDGSPDKARAYKHALHIAL